MVLRMARRLLELELRAALVGMQGLLRLLLEQQEELMHLLEAVYRPQQQRQQQQRQRPRNWRERLR